MVYITYSNISLMTLKFAVVFVSLSLVCTAQPILNNNNNDDDQSQEDLLSDAAPAVAQVKKEQRSGRTKTSSARIQLVVDNDEARRKYFERREQYLHESLNGANGHWVKGKDESDAAASAIPELKDDAAPVATPQNLLALLKRRPGFKGTKSGVQRVIRQVITPGFPITHPVAGFPHPVAFQSPHVPQHPPHPVAAPVEIETTPAPVTSAVAPSIQKARDDYRKNRFAGGNAAYLLALKLSKAGNVPVSDGGSYSG